MRTKITILCENSVYMPLRLIGEHGLSILIESGDITLFDTGQGIGIINNLRVLGKDVSSIDRIILSHGHYDHTGGLFNILENYPGNMPVYVNPDAFKEKISIFGWIENMRGFLCQNCGQRQELVSTGPSSRAIFLNEVPFLGRIPIDTNLNEFVDTREASLEKCTDSQAMGCYNLIVQKIMQCI